MVLDKRALTALGNGAKNVLGAEIKIDGQAYRVTAVLPASFEFLSRQPTVYRMERLSYLQKAFIVARVKPGVSEERLSKELARIAAEVCAYYYLQGQMRFSTWRGALLTPLISFSIATLLASIIAWMAFRPRLRQIRLAFEPENRRTATRRVLFFLSKTGLGLACVFVGCLEWSRSESSVLTGLARPGKRPLPALALRFGHHGCAVLGGGGSAGALPGLLTAHGLPCAHRLPRLFAARLVGHRTVLQRGTRLTPCPPHGAQLGRRSRPVDFSGRFVEGLVRPRKIIWKFS